MARVGPLRAEGLPQLPAAAELRGLDDPKIAEHSLGFFKTGPGEYGEGDRFLGIRVPVLRKLVPGADDLSNDDVLGLLRSEFHEERMFALFLLVRRFERGSEDEQRWVFRSYLDHTALINNWDLVDTAAPKLIRPPVEAG